MTNSPHGEATIPVQCINIREVSSGALLWTQELDIQLEVFQWKRLILLPHVIIEVTCVDGSMFETNLEMVGAEIMQSSCARE